jgi:hypothetical protein
MPNSAKKQSGSQHREFVKAARELGTDESEDAFDKVLKRIASASTAKVSAEAEEESPPGVRGVSMIQID